MKGIQQATSATGTPIRTFYCRWTNRVVHACRRDGGPKACPLRRECTADSLLHPLPDAPRLVSS